MLLNKRLIVLLLFFLINNNLFASDLVNVSLNQFTNRVSKQTNKNIFIDEDINSSMSLFIPNKISNKAIFDIYKMSIEKRGFNLSVNNGVYYLHKKTNYKKHFYLFQLKYNVSKDFLQYLKMLKYNYSYFRSNNSFLVSCNFLQKRDIDKFLQTLDKQSKQVMLKFYIISYDDTKTDERGIQFASIYKDASNVVQTAINAIVMPLTSTSNILSTTSFFSALRLLNEAHKIKINNFPYVLAKQNKLFQFESVRNIPYLVKSTTTDSNTVQDNNSYQYKDVGLKIGGIASIYKDFVSLELKLTIEDIIDSGSDSKTPSTNKRYLNSVTNLKYGQVLLLSGIKQDKQANTNIRIPILCNIPFIGKMFQYKYTSVIKSNISIAIQVIKSVGLSANATLPPSSERTSGKER